MKDFLLCSLVLAAACAHAAEEKAEDIARVREAGKQSDLRLAERKVAEEAAQKANKAAMAMTDKEAAARTATAANVALVKAGDAQLAAEEVFKRAAAKAPKEAQRIVKESCDAVRAADLAKNAARNSAALAAKAAREAAAKKAYDELPQAVKDAEKASAVHD